VPPLGGRVRVTEEFAEPWGSRTRARTVETGIRTVGIARLSYSTVADPPLTVAVVNSYTNLGKKLPSRLAFVRRMFGTLRGGTWGSGAPVASALARSAAAQRALLAAMLRRWIGK
jgi:hypothetical protein